MTGPSCKICAAIGDGCVLAVLLLFSCSGQSATRGATNASPTGVHVTPAAGSPGVSPAAENPATPSPSPASSTTGGTWSAAAAMGTARSYHTATLLPSGKVLVTGGYTGPLGSTVLASAELYDPATNIWSAAAPMLVPHSAHTATLLLNGKVLIVAGRSSSGDSTSAELYDPASNSWSPAGNMMVARTSHTALLLRSGKVLVWGGYGPAGVNPPAELYDPGSNTWSVIRATGDHFINVAIALDDRRVLTLGDIQSSNFQFAAIFDPSSNAWTPAGLPPVSMASGVLLASGRVLFFGNYAATNKRAAEEYDPTSNTWLPVSPMAIALWGRPVVLSDDRVLVAGSALNAEPGCGSGCANAEVFDPTQGTWALTRSMTTDRGEQTMTLLADGKVLVAGGNIPPNPDSTPASEIFDPTA